MGTTDEPTVRENKLFRNASPILVTFLMHQHLLPAGKVGKSCGFKSDKNVMDSNSLLCSFFPMAITVMHRNGPFKWQGMHK
jgi:hypothetical protein